MELKLRLYPDPVLLKEAVPVTAFDDAFRERVAEMHRIMYDEGGVGLAAPQVGWSVQLLVLNPAGKDDDTEAAMTIVNPKIVKKWGKATAQEGCLSFPEIFIDVQRPAGVKLSYQDEFGEQHEDDLNEFVARIVQHEKDHLDGVLLYHRMSPTDRIKYRAHLSELVYAYEDALDAARESESA